MCRDKNETVSHIRSSVVSPTTLDQIERLPIMPELDNVPTLEELPGAIKGISSGKAAESNGIPTDVLKFDCDQLHIVLHQLLCKWWEEGAFPQEM